ncbi:LacI family DNA-binding transcriptional regulator [Hoeflea prorocentri]|uniref:LacI family DNA-binding transcriptional regulator n=1 Tax=Hoeflea prorocentri TaxID=1922333 RepID=A0A9X3UHT6_9HYPH|nr:LacI family DNA-binding transcriptional regulator [Hoeflea prorocentri]MCY6381602.1 LacI family DNA-binding transcriptional regulator [Hoeflea prorocentri]MDA5399402.1 LacI family DNA-binding transcriptional regulator [Hoeflea prorocentri]
MNVTTDHATPTLDDVAREAGVSTATVSRCLNTSDLVSKKTRDKVMSAVELLGYTPNFGARAMAAKRTFTIGAIIPTMENAIFARGLQAFQERLHEKGYTLLVSSTAYRPELEAEQIRSLVSRGADGLLLIGYERDDAVYKYLERRRVPTLAAWAFSDDSPLPSVGFDNQASMLELCNTVLAMGHTEIAVISGIVEGNDRAAKRLEGIRDSLRAHGIDPDRAPVIETSYEIENGAKAFEKLMQAPARPTAVMCGNDVLAVGAMQRAREMGMDVPDDVSITGFDDIELATIVTPQLTTVHVPHRQMGRLAADELIRMVEKDSIGESSQLQSSLRLRGSLKALDDLPANG